MPTKNGYSIFEYLYRDAGNYKAWGSIILTGTFSNDELIELAKCVEGDGLFVAEQVGIPVLYKELYQYSGGPTIDDHAFHEFSEIRIATAAEVEAEKPWGTGNKLLGAFRSVKSWDVTLSPHCDSLW